MNQKPWIGLIQLDIFKHTVAVYLTDESRIEGLKEFNVPNAPPLDVEVYGAVTCDVSEDGVLVLSLLLPPEGQSQISTWVHEAVHITDILLDHLGFPGSIDNTEIRAYMTQHVFEQIDFILHNTVSKKALKKGKKPKKEKE